MRLSVGQTTVRPMTSPLRILMLAGSMEARQLGAALLSAGHEVRALVSETPRGGAVLGVPFALHRQMNVQDVRAAAEDMGADVLIDASHGFDAAASEAGWQAAGALGLPVMRLARPLWQASESPRWHHAADVPAAMGLIAPGARVFSATGWDSLPGYAAFPGAKLLLRQTRAHSRPVPFPFVEPVFGLPPFTEDSEVQLFEGMGVDLLICRNLGGRASRPKLDAALRLGLDVILVDPPPRPEGLYCVQGIDAALGWLEAL